MAKSSILRSMRTFLVLWFGQTISTLGSGLTGFALGVWVYQQTQSTTLFALNMLAYALPNLLVSPFAGALVDRWDRRWAMIFSDTGAGLSTLVIALLYWNGDLQVWHVFIATAFNSAFSTFQWPAYSAATSLMVPKEQLGRAGGLVQIGEAISQLVSPVIAGALYVTAGLPAIILIDFATYFFAVGTALFVRVPRPAPSAEAAAGRGSLLKEAAFGWHYIVARPGLWGLLMVFAFTNLLSGLTNPLLAPMILDMTSPEVLGLLGSLIGIGMLVGTLVMSAWGGPKKKVHGVLGFMMISGVFMMLLGLRPSIPLMATAGFLMMFTMPIINGSSQAIWQRKVTHDVQGRVFSIRRMIAWSTTPLAYILAGPLNDQVFRPLLLEGGSLASSVGRIVGVGPGRGTGLLIMVTGFLIILVSGSGYLNPRVRRLEAELPDALPDEPAAVEQASTDPAQASMPQEEGAIAEAAQPAD